MQSWTAPRVPRLPGRGDIPQIHDTAAQAVVPSATGPSARMYACGITPYDATHSGHANTYLAFDSLNRAWRDAGLSVRYVQNVTDIDNPLLERAAQTGDDWEALARRETDIFRADMAALRMLPPDEFVGAVEAIPDIVDLVLLLRDKGAAYDLDGDIYFSVAAAGHFPAVSHYSTEQMLALSAERGGDPDRPGKKDPLDCLLWQAARPGEPSWTTQLGEGRPGWHVECAAIALKHLGTAYDVNGGGADLVFPHHELGAAEATTVTGEPLARAYVHAGMVAYQGEKMSKSRGNLVFVHRLRAQGVEPGAIRLALLAHHYRADWEWTQDTVSDAQTRLDRWRTAVARPSGSSGDDVLRQVRAALAADLDTPSAVGVIDRWAAEPGDDPEAPALVCAAVDALLGVALPG